MNDLDRLFSAWLAGPLDDGDAQRLRELLDDPRQRRRWRELADLEGALAERGAAVAAEPERASPHATRRMPLIVPRRWRPLAMAALLVVVIGGVWLLRPAPDPDLPTRDGRQLARGESVIGPAVLGWPDGSEARIAADGKIRVSLTGMGLYLDDGEVAVHATPQDVPRFTVQTREARAEVIGTRFNLRRADGATVLQVDEGLVQFTPADGEVQVISAGGKARAGRIDVPSAGLVAWWPLNEGSGAKARDASGNGHAGHIVGPRWTAEGLRFAGEDQRIDIIPSGRLATLHEGDYSISAWYRPESLPTRTAPDDPQGRRDGHSVIVGRTGWTLGLHLGSDGIFFMQHFLRDQSPQAQRASEPAEPGRWYHLVGVVDRHRGETRLAVDGITVGRRTWKAGAEPYLYGPEDLWRIGIANPGAVGSRWPARGLIREVRLYARALDTDEIARLAAR